MTLNGKKLPVSDLVGGVGDLAVGGGPGCRWGTCRWNRDLVWVG